MAAHNFPHIAFHINARKNTFFYRSPSILISYSIQVYTLKSCLFSPAFADHILSVFNSVGPILSVRQNQTNSKFVPRCFAAKPMPSSFHQLYTRFHSSFRPRRPLFSIHQHRCSSSGLLNRGPFLPSRSVFTQILKMTCKNDCKPCWTSLGRIGCKTNGHKHLLSQQTHVPSPSRTIAWAECTLNWWQCQMQRNLILCQQLCIHRWQRWGTR